MELKFENNLLKLEIDYLTLEDDELTIGRKTLIIGIYKPNRLDLNNQEKIDINDIEMKGGKKENGQNEG